MRLSEARRVVLEALDSPYPFELGPTRDIGNGPQRTVRFTASDGIEYRMVLESMNSALVPRGGGYAGAIHGSGGDPRTAFRVFATAVAALRAHMENPDKGPLFISIMTPDVVRGKANPRVRLYDRLMRRGLNVPGWKVKRDAYGNYGTSRWRIAHESVFRRARGS